MKIIILTLVIMFSSCNVVKETIGEGPCDGEDENIHSLHVKLGTLYFKKNYCQEILKKWTTNEFNHYADVVNKENDVYSYRGSPINFKGKCDITASIHTLTKRIQWRYDLCVDALPWQRWIAMKLYFYELEKKK